MAGPEIGVFVLGMHRSGTSATTRAINLLGVPTATETELKRPSQNNPTGFWEVEALTDFNNRLLAELGGSSLAPPLLEPGWAGRADLERRRRRGRRLFGRAHPTESWVWKDPRNCVLFPFWRETLDASPVVVLVHRDPKAVARSLEARQGLSTAMSYAVWERYMREVLAAVDGLPVLVSPYAALIEDPAEWARGATVFLREQGIECGAAGAGEHVSAFIRSPERGTPATADDSAPPPDLELSDEQRSLEGAIGALSGAHSRFEAPKLAPETVWTEPLLAERRRADILRQQMEERLQATRRRLRTVKAGESDAEELPKRSASDEASSQRARRRLRRPGILSRGSSPAAPGDGAGRMPDYLIIGAQKSGTSSLFRYLGESPEVELPTEKEIHFFDNNFDRGVDWYRSHFPARRRGGRSLTGEASPYYLFHPLAPHRIRELAPEVRLIAVLRNPADRAVSHYYHEVGNGFEDLPLVAALDREGERLAGEEERIREEPGYSSFNHRHFSYQARGVYVDQLALWRSVFPSDQILVLESESLFRDPVTEMRTVYEFLGLRGDPPPDLGAYNQRDYPAIPRSVEERLVEHFAGHNARLREFTGRDFGWPG